MSEFLERIKHIPILSVGKHNTLNDGACIIEAVSYIAGEPWSDNPTCVCPVISSFLRRWNDDLPNGRRDELLRPLIPLLIGTKKNKEIEHRRSIMCIDWIIRENTSAWLRLGGLNAHADALSALPEITNIGQLPTLMPVLLSAKQDAATAMVSVLPAAARAAIRAAAARGATRGVAVWSATMEAAGGAAMTAVTDTAMDAVMDEVWAEAVWAAEVWAASAWAAAWGADRKAPMAAMSKTVTELQESALRLVHRMIDCN